MMGCVLCEWVKEIKHENLLKALCKEGGTQRLNLKSSGFKFNPGGFKNLIRLDLNLIKPKFNKN